MSRRLSLPLIVSLAVATGLLVPNIGAAQALSQGTVSFLRV
jgi:hypothetical protein